MTIIRIQSIAHGSQTYGGHGSDYTQEVTVEELAEAYERLDRILKKTGRTLIPQKIENKLLEEGVIGPSNGSGVYFFQDCLVENKFVPTILDGSFHLVEVAGPTSGVRVLISSIKSPRLSYPHCTKKPETYSIPGDFDISRFKSISELENLLKNGRRKTG